jgi:hypothetical protein
MFNIQAIDDFRLKMDQTQRLKKYRISGVEVSMISMGVFGWPLATGFWQLVKPIRATFRKSQWPGTSCQ